MYAGWRLDCADFLVLVRMGWEAECALDGSYRRPGFFQHWRFVSFYQLILECINDN